MQVNIQNMIIEPASNMALFIKVFPASSLTMNHGSNSSVYIETKKKTEKREVLSAFLQLVCYLNLHLSLIHFASGERVNYLYRYSGDPLASPVKIEKGCHSFSPFVSFPF
jgi:hypothetical protein